MSRELHGLVRQGELVWARLCEPDEAQDVAVAAAVNGGMCELLTGEDLAMHLLGGAGRLSPAISLEETWKPGERVEQVPLRGRRQAPRRGKVERIDRTYGYRESLVVAFDDGETRTINPDVMRHTREKEKA